MVTAAEIKLEKFRKLKAEREKLELAGKVLRGELVDRGEIEAILWGGAQSLKQIITGSLNMSREEKDSLLRAIAGIKIRVVTTENLNNHDLINERKVQRGQKQRGRPPKDKAKANGTPAPA